MFVNIVDSLEQLEAVQRQVYVQNNSIVLDVAYEYSIALSRCDTAEKLLSWVLHLQQKTWVNSLITERFVSLACQANGIRLDDAL